MLFNTMLGDLIAQPKPTSGQVEAGLVYAIAAFVVIWLFIAAYLFWLNRRQESLRREVELLRQEEAERLRSGSREVEPGFSNQGSGVGRPELGG